MKFLQSLPLYLIGSGNVAWHISKAFSHANIPIKGIWSRNINKAKDIANTFCIDLFKDDSFFEFEGIFFLAVSDNAIDLLASRINPNSILIHTSGSTSMDVLLKTHKKAGVFYPFQTFTKYRNIDFSSFPILIEYSEDEAGEILKDLANRLNAKYYYCDSKNRLNYHISAVFACNFVNHLLAISEIWLKNNGLNFNFLYPIIQETIKKAIENDPVASQTGPAIRNDNITIEKHLEMLEKHNDLKKLYEILTESIIKFNSKMK